MKKNFKFLALATILGAMSTNAFAAVGDTFLGADGVLYKITSEYQAPAAGVPEKFGEVTLINYGYSTKTDALVIPSVTYNQDATNITIPAGNRYNVVGINGMEDTEITINGIKVNAADQTQAFLNCSASSITLPTSVIYIGKSAFQGYKGTAVNIPVGSQLAKIDDNAFLNAAALATFATENATWLAEIGDNAFKGCTALTSISPSAKLTSIGTGAFLGTGITELDLSACTAFTTANGAVIDRWFTTGVAPYATNNKLATVKLPALTGSNVIAIEDDAFNGCTALAQVGAVAASATIPNTISGIGDGAFKKTNITKFDIASNSKILSIGDWFSTGNDSKLQQIVLNNVAYTGFDVDGIKTLKKIGIASAEYALPAKTTAGAIVEGMFAGTALEQLDLSKITATIAELPCLFNKAGNSALTAVVLNNNTTALAAYAFANCTSLANITVKDKDGNAKEGLTTLVTINTGAFHRTALTALQFGAALTAISKPFYGQTFDASAQLLPFSTAESLSIDMSKSIAVGTVACSNTIQFDEYAGLTAAEQADYTADDNFVYTIIDNADITAAAYTAASTTVQALYEASVYTFDATKFNDTDHEGCVLATTYDAYTQTDTKGLFVAAWYQTGTEEPITAEAYAALADKTGYNPYSYSLVNGNESKNATGFAALSTEAQGLYAASMYAVKTANLTVNGATTFGALATDVKALYAQSAGTYTSTVAAATNPTLPADLFNGVAALTSITLPYDAETAVGLYAIGANAFEGTGIAEIALPKTIHQDATAADRGIKSNAFKDCKSLKKMTYTPDTKTTSIFQDNTVFSGCGLVSIYVPTDFAAVGGPVTATLAPTNSKWVTASPVEFTTVKDKVKSYAMKGFFNNESAYQFDATECDVYEAYLDGENIVLSPLRKRDGKYNVDAKQAVIVRTAEAKKISPVGITIGGTIKSSVVYGKTADLNYLPTQTENVLASVKELTARESVKSTADWTTACYGNYMYALVNNATYGFSFQYYTGNNLNVGNIYVICSKAPAAGRLNMIWLDENGNVVEDETTAIESINAAEAAEGEIYNLQGVRVNGAQKGIYIKNGKKFIVK